MPINTLLYGSPTLKTNIVDALTKDINMSDAFQANNTIDILAYKDLINQMIYKTLNGKYIFNKDFVDAYTTSSASYAFIRVQEEQCSTEFPELEMSYPDDPSASSIIGYAETRYKNSVKRHKYNSEDISKNDVMTIELNKSSLNLCFDLRVSSTQYVNIVIYRILNNRELISTIDKDQYYLNISYNYYNNSEYVSANGKLNISSEALQDKESLRTFIFNQELISSTEDNSKNMAQSKSMYGITRGSNLNNNLTTYDKENETKLYNFILEHHETFKKIDTYMCDLSNEVLSSFKITFKNFSVLNDVLNEYMTSKEK